MRSPVHPNFQATQFRAGFGSRPFGIFLEIFHALAHLFSLASIRGSGFLLRISRIRHGIFFASRGGA
jgi:hypothetical protein